MRQHEVYFESLRPSEPGPTLLTQMEKDFWGFDRWAVEFAALAKALAGGSGWVLLCWAARDGVLVNTWADDHTHNLLFSWRSTCTSIAITWILARGRKMTGSPFR